MPGAPRPFRDGLIAVSVGGVLALLLVFGVRAQVGERPAVPANPAVPVITPGPGTDACQRFDVGGGGVPQLDPSPGPEFPRQEFLLDTGRPLEVRGTGNAEIAYQRLGEFATVVDFDCQNCSGNLTVFNTGAAVPIVSGEAIGEPVEIEWLIDTDQDQATAGSNSLLIGAQGDWSLTLRSWYDLPISSGPVEGRGAQVVRLQAQQVRITFAPLNSRDALHAYAYRVADGEFRASTCIGRRESQTVELDGGEVLLVWALGEWTIEPL